MNDKYNERVRALAEKMALLHSPGLKKLPDYGMRVIENEIPRAKIALAEAAEAVIIYAFGSLQDYKFFKEKDADDDYMARALKEQGLIPEKEVSNDI